MKITMLKHLRSLQLPQAAAEARVRANKQHQQSPKHALAGSVTQGNKPV
jgi:hypothetical protein